MDLSARLKYFEYESRVKEIPIGANRRRGAPGKTKNVLTFQPSDEQNVLSADSEPESDVNESDVVVAKVKRGRKKAAKVDSESSEESDLELFKDAPVRRERRSGTSSKTPISSKSTTNNNSCESCGKQLVKKRGYYCPSGCNRKNKK